MSDDATISAEVEAKSLADAMAEATSIAEAGGFAAFKWTGATIEKTEQRTGFIAESDNRWTVTISIKRKQLRPSDG